MKILASSLCNFLILDNAHTTSAPYVTFSVTNPSNVTIIIKDANNADGYYKEIVGNSSSTISSDSFNTGGIVTLNLMECLKLNSIFYNIELLSSNVIKAMIDTSISYNITVSGSGITIGGTYNSYQALSPNKMVVMLNDGEANITLEKYNNNPTISFDITSPYRYTSLRYPLDINITAYQVYDSKASMVTVPYSAATIMPTTLTKFQKVDYDNYLYTGGTQVHFLTNNEKRYYNYDEWIGISFLSTLNLAYPRLKKDFYTNSGVYIDTVWSTQLIEKSGDSVKRFDMYDKFDLANIEYTSGKQVGYVLVYFVNGDGSTTELSQPVRFDVLPKCKGNNEIFFLNEIGGIDSFNFTGSRSDDYSIDNLSTYFINPIKDYIESYELENVKQKRNKIVHTLSTHMVDYNTASWLNEMNKSKYAFKFLGMQAPMFKTIIIDKFDITTNNNDDEFELDMEYHDADNNENI